MNLARTPFQSWKFTRSIIISEKYEENMKKKKRGKDYANLIKLPLNPLESEARRKHLGQ